MPRTSAFIDREPDTGACPLPPPPVEGTAWLIDAWGWLPGDHGTDAMVDYAREHGADLLLLPAELDEPGLGERLKGETVAKAVEEASERDPGLAVLLVAADGSTELAKGRL